MSFRKITNPKKRDEIIKDFLKTKENIRQNNRTERLGESNTQNYFATMLKPVTESQKMIVSELAPIREAIQKSTTALPIEGLPEILEQPPVGLGRIAAQYLKKYLAKGADVDKTFGIYNKDGKLYIGDKEVGVEEDNLTVGDVEYVGTRGLWELLIQSRPDYNIYTDDDFAKYSEIMYQTNSLRKNNDENSKKPKASKSWKWKNLMKNIWENREGRGLTKFLPSDPKALMERFKLLLASKKAGNTGVRRNELVSISDELIRQNLIDKNTYKKIMLEINR